MKFLLFAAGAAAFPSMLNSIALEKSGVVLSNLAKRELERGVKLEIERRSVLKRQDLTQDPLGLSRAQTNCGPTPCLGFNEADQLVSVSGEHAYVAPAAGDIRGPCPGLNAAANHGYLPRNGVASIEETIAGLGAAYNMAPTLAAALSAYAIAIDGNLVEGVWSIGGPLPVDELVGGLLGTGQGLSYSQYVLEISDTDDSNNYEGDASIGRGDAYTNNGDAHSLNISKFEAVYAVGGPGALENLPKSIDIPEDRYTLDKFRQKYESVQDAAIAENPYYFTGAFSTIVVVPAAYNFVINFMSNHSAAEPNGYLDGYNFKTFFGVSGEPGSFVWNRGQERIPEDWYRRPSTTPYTLQDVAFDVGLQYLAYPRSLKVGGNTGTVNSFVGVDVANLTGGVLNAQTLFEGDNFACFAFNLAQQAIPAFLKLPLLQINKALSFLDSYLEPIFSVLECPQLGQYDQGLFDKYPGRTYSPTGPATNYKA